MGVETAAQICMHTAKLHLHAAPTWQRTAEFLLAAPPARLVTCEAWLFCDYFVAGILQLLQEHLLLRMHELIWC